MRKLWLLLIGVVVLGTGCLVYWLTFDPEVTPGVVAQDVRAPDLGEPFVHANESADAGVGRVSGRVIDHEFKPVAGAKVRLFAHGSELEELECGLCHAAVLDCQDSATVARVIQMLRGGAVRPPPILAEVTTDADGTFVFEAAPLDGEVVALSQRMSAAAASDGEELELVLEAPLVEQVHVADFEGKPVLSARVTLYSPRDGTLVEKRVDAEGMVQLESSDRRAWFFAESEGTLPAGQRLEMGGEVVLSPPRTLIIRTMLGGRPTEADVELTIHGEPRKLRSKGGVLTLEQLPFRYYSVMVSTDELVAAEQSAELVEPVTELVFELRGGAKLLVTVVSSTGEPLEQVNGSLSSSETNTSNDASEGALLILGPVPEGEYTLELTSEGMVGIERSIDLKPGETAIEVVMRSAPKLTGMVVGPQGKPAPMTRVGAWEGEQEIALGLTDEDGHFEVELHYPGTFLLKAEDQRVGVGEATAVAPGPSVTIRLVARGVLEVEVFDADGQPLPCDVTVRSEKDQSMKWVDDDEGKVGRLAGLAAGFYFVEKTVPERLPLTQKVEIIDGKVSRVTLKAERGASVSGKVIDHLGKPVEQAVVAVNGQQSVTAADGRFEVKGVAPGSVAVFAVGPSGGETPTQQVTAPATELVLTLPVVARVTGRVVDQAGVPVTSFDANGERVKTETGRFDVPAPNKSLDVWAEGYAMAFVTPAEGDVGDVVVKKEPVVEGEVVDGEGKPVSGATVMATVDLTPVSTDAAGRFKLTLSTEDPQEVVATRGAMSGRTQLRVGAVAHIVMARGTALTGKVVDPTGKPVPTRVTAVSRVTTRPMEIDTDENGRFEFDLPQGVWLFSTRFNRVQRAIDVRGPKMEVTLGEEAGACGISLRSSKPIDAVWLLTVPMADEQGPWDLVGTAAGSVEVPVSVAALEINARGLPCGRYTLAASIENVVTSAPLELRSAGQRVELEPRQLEP
ncbi:MAG: hypothetical protein Q8K32_15670 [Archangium sp.]|nr:hypothetical protein [Archangium sp.]